MSSSDFESSGFDTATEVVHSGERIAPTVALGGTADWVASQFGGTTDQTQLASNAIDGTCGTFSHTSQIE